MPEYKLRIVIEGEDRASGALNSVKASLGGIGQIAAGVGLGNLLSGGVQALGGIARGALDSYASFERLGMSINSLAAKEALLTGQASSMSEALGKTAGKSKELLEWVQKLAIESPFRQEDVSQAFRLSMALGFNTAEAQRLTEAMVDFSTATGAGGETIERVSRALGQIRTKGKLSMEEVNQLTESGVDVMRVLAEMTGKTGQALVKDISGGAISAQAAIEAILADTERLYAGAGDAAATSMAGLLSTMSEVSEISSRNLLAGFFEAVQEPLGNVVGILMAPEFQAGLSAWGDTLGNLTVGGLTEAAAALERMDAAVAPLLDKAAPPWLVALQGVAALGGAEFKIDIKPNVTSITTPDGGLNVEVTATATTITNKDGGLFKVDAEAQVISIKPDAESPTINFVADWKEGTIGSLIAAAQASTGGEQNKVLLDAGWDETALSSIKQAINTLKLSVEVNPMLNIAKASLAATLWGIGVGGRLLDGIDAKVKTFSWEQYKADWSAALATWQPAMTGLATVGNNIFTTIQSVFNEPVMMSGSWRDGTTTGLFGDIQTPFNEPIMMVGSWVEGVISGMWDAVQAWFSASPISIPLQPVYPDGMTPAGMDAGTQLPIDVTKPAPQAYYDPVTGEVEYRATGDPYFYGGWAVVGEEGPELVNLPRGARIFNNSDTKAMLGAPGFAEGTTQIPDWLKRILGGAGLWVEQPSAKMGPKTKDEAWGDWNAFQQDGSEAFRSVAQTTGDNFEQAAEQTESAFSDALSSALQGVPGLFGTSQVTADQMRLAELGVPQNFADDYLRQLTDEVVNGVDWEGVDIGDAARRAGIDPGLPAEVILELFRSAWQDSSLFANPENLDLINQDAVQAAIEQQQAEAAGRVNIMALFGLTDEGAQKQADALGAGLASVFGQAADSDAFKTAGVGIFDRITAGLSDPGTAAAGMGDMANVIKSATGTPENQQLLYDAGKAGYAAYLRGWYAAAAEAPIAPPSGSSDTTPPIEPPPGNALGTPNWRGGWTVVGEYGPELANLPSGTRIHDAASTRRLRARASGSVTVVNNNYINDRLMAEQVAQRTAQRIQRRSR